MALPSFFSKFSAEKKETPEQFLALEISSNFVKSAIWQVREEKIQLISFGGVEKWDGQDLDELVVLADSSIGKAVELQEQEPNKVLFGLPETWVDGDKIVPPRLRDLRAVSRKLDLKPQGFVVTTEAVISYLKILEGVPLNAILIRLMEDEVAVSLVKAGKSLGTQVVGRSDELGADVYEALVRFPQKEGLPPRILVFNAASSLEKEEQSLVSFDWGSLFLHFPRVEILDKEFSIKAISIAGGWEVAKSKGFAVKPMEGVKKELSPLVQEVEEEIKEETAADLGFMIDKDIQVEKEVEKETPPPKPAETQELTFEEKEVISGEIPVVKKVKKRLPLPRLNFAIFKNLMHLILATPRQLTSVISFKWNFYFLLTLIFLLITLLVGGTFAFYWYAPSAQVILFVKAKDFSSEVEATVDPQVFSIDYEKFLLPGEEVEATVSESQTAQATGEKVVGEKAKGEITVYNKTEKGKTFSQGTILVGPEGLSFLTDEEIEVASSSAQEQEGGAVITYGKKKVNVTAKDIGPDYNFSAGTEFSFKDFSSDAYSAKNETAFSGGTSRKVKVISEKDQEGLLEELSKNLKKKAAEDLRKKISQDQEVFEEGIVLETVSKKFDKEVDDEGENLKLDLEIKAKTLTFAKKDLRELLFKQIKDSLPEGYKVDESETKIGIEEGKFKEGQAEFKGTVEAKLIFQYDLERIKEEIKGKYPQVTQEYFENLPGFKKVEIEISPAFLPAKLKTFPRKTKNINIQVKIVD